MTAHTSRFSMWKKHIKGVMESTDSPAGQLQSGYSCYFRILGIFRSMVCHDSCLEAVCQSAGPQVMPAFPSTNRFKYLCSAVTLPSKEASSRGSCGLPSITLSQVPSGILWVDHYILSHLSHWLTEFSSIFSSWVLHVSWSLGALFPKAGFWDWDEALTRWMYEFAIHKGCNIAWFHFSHILVISLHLSPNSSVINISGFTVDWFKGYLKIILTINLLNSEWI